MNRFCSIRNLATADQRTVNAPNNDTPYSLAWLDLRKQPQVLHAPPIKNRFWEFELVDPWTNNFYNITSAHRKMGAGDFNVTEGGDWAVVGPDFKGKLPRGVKRVELALRPRLDRRPHLPPRPERTSATCTGSRTSTRSPRCRSSAPTTSRRARGRSSPRSTEATIPGTQPGEDPLAFYAALGKEMLKFPPPAADRPLLAQLKAVGIGPGLSPANAQPQRRHAPRPARRGHPGSEQGPGRRARALPRRGSTSTTATWSPISADWGTELHRCARSATGSASAASARASRPTRSPCSTTRRRRSPDRSATSCTSPRAACPIPVKAFWSLTMYDTNSFFVPNPLNRYLHQQPLAAAQRTPTGRSTSTSSTTSRPTRPR